ncbi:MAG: cell division protein FtsZ [Bacteroidota bacterium]|jgi:cell division protein FtsZ
MIQFDLPLAQSSIIKVIGVGGGGSNAVNYMHSLDIEGVDFIVCNTDAQALALSKVPNKIQLGPSLTQGLGAGANPEIGKQATQESLEEIRRILEVNTKMAFVTAGMGGGTGTGGAPIIAKICKDMGILTVGIVTTPFSYEGKKRALFAEAGIKELKSQVDTLLVISNDKLRHQFGNLTMSAALSTADNVLSTAAKCITDVINTTGQINVDFADVCTVMRNGGVAILGSARAKGEDRAQMAIEQALNSPLLNDNDIRGAKWVLININSRAGETEFTMDEVETIQQYLLTQAGPDADVILGLGYDDSLGDEISITIIATGFEQKSPFGEKPEAKQEEVKDERIMFTLDINPQPKPEIVSLLPVEEKQVVEETSVLEETPVQILIEEPVQALEEEPVHTPVEEPVTASLETIQETLIEMPVLVEEKEEIAAEQLEEEPVVEEVVEMEAEKPIIFELDLGIVDQEEEAAAMELPSYPAVTEEVKAIQQEVVAETEKPITTPTGFLVKPAMIYVEESKEEASLDLVTKEEMAPVSMVEEKPVEPIAEIRTAQVEADSSLPESIELVYHDEEIKDFTPAVEEPVFEAPLIDTPTVFDEAGAQKARAAERLQKLRNLSFNFNSSDASSEYENIPAYVRHNLQVHNTTLASVEKFYSSYAVGTDENNVAQISTINTFLEGKKPD